MESCNGRSTAELAHGERGWADKNVNAAQSRARCTKTARIVRIQGENVSGSLIGVDGARLGETEAPGIDSKIHLLLLISITAREF